RRQDRGVHRQPREADARRGQGHGRAPRRQGRRLRLGQDRHPGRRPRRRIQAQGGREARRPGDRRDAVAATGGRLGAAPATGAEQGAQPMLSSVMTAAALVALAAPAAADEAADLLRQGLYDGDRAAAAGRLSELAAEGDAEARFAIGFTAFVDAAEALAADLYRYGLAVPDPGAFGPALGM